LELRVVDIEPWLRGQARQTVGETAEHGGECDSSEYQAVELPPTWKYNVSSTQKGSSSTKSLDGYTQDGNYIIF
jgi:hypothetical protein